MEEARLLVEDLLDKHFDVQALQTLFFQRKARFAKGIDRVDSRRFEGRIGEESTRINQRLMAGTYKYAPYVEMLVSKGRDKAPRLIARATVRDKLTLTALKNVLHEALPGEVPRKLPNQVVRSLLETLALNQNCRIVRGDITAFYDKISHPKLKAMLKSRIASEIVVASVMLAVEGAVVPLNYRRADIKRYVNTRGVPQGLPISNFLANLYLTKFDRKMRESMISYHRYVDDLILISEDGRQKQVTDLLARSLRGLGLSLNKEKTKDFAFDDRFEFLGYEIQSGNARPRTASVEKFIRGIASLFSQLRERRLPGRKLPSEWGDEELGDVFVQELNERITGAISQHKQYGWVFYFNESTDLSSFARVDKIVKLMARRTPYLTNRMRGQIKSVVRTFFESKYSKTSGYITNYDSLETYKEQVRFLVNMGYVDPKEGEGMSPGRVEARFREVVAVRLSRLDQDVGLVS